MSLRFLLDTNIISQPIAPRPNQKAMSRLQRYEGEVAICPTVWQEIVHGISKLPEDSRRRYRLEMYLKTLRLPMLPYDKRAARWHGEQRARFHDAPKPYDSEIAAVAVVNDLVLVTNNTKDFVIFEDLTIEDWLE